MSRLEIKNGIVYDPANGVSGEKKDILIEDGEVVESFSGDSVETIDASDKIVMPGGVDIHSHIAGSKVNAGRKIRPEEGRTYYSNKEYPRAGAGKSILSTFSTGYLYAKLGWTTVVDPAMPPLEARHTHEELSDIPIIDKAAYPLVGNNWIVMEYLKDDDLEGLAAYISWLLKVTKGYALKIVNPGGTESWGWGKNVGGLDDTVRHFDVTPADIIEGLQEVNEMLGLPHSIHVHGNNLGMPGNYRTALDTFDITKGVKSGSPDRDSVFHLTHAQFNSYAGKSWKEFSSGAEEIAKKVNQRDDVAIDMGQVIFGNTTTMTSDGPFQYNLQRLNHLKWVNADVEMETGAGIVPFVYHENHPVNAVQWAAGLELALQVDDPGKVMLTTDHPNGGPFTSYPKVISWLVSREARKAEMENVHKNVEKATTLTSLDRELSLGDVTQMSRSATAKVLGMTNRGHLGPGAKGDVAIYDLNPEKVDLSKEYEKVREAFENAAYCVKDGEVVVKDGEVKKDKYGSTLWVDSKVSDDLEEEVSKEIRKKFKKYYTVNIDNYPTQAEYVKNSEKISIDATDL
ncbi:protein fwdA [candidate division MSBL1 archaeon SCGC-AAA382A03]|uniref:Protein fwdA n=1 Tax=candidate division MSBL1 archaeon SCGC-AAA382A03 TaxID=1698278 RepID=A0A133VFK0_9EURY|nr:protein fwdA [candidate division MSBL1 archaeon SCGC-AAA382A03]